MKLDKNMSIQLGNQINTSSVLFNHSLSSFYSELGSKCIYVLTNTYRMQESIAAHMQQLLENGDNYN